MRTGTEGALRPSRGLGIVMVYIVVASVVMAHIVVAFICMAHAGGSRSTPRDGAFSDDACRQSGTGICSGPI